MHGWLTLLLQHDLNKPKQLKSSRTLHMLHWTIQLLRKFANPTIFAFLVLRYVRNDNKLHFHISLVTQKRGDYTFLLDLVKTMDIQISKMWASPHVDVGFSSNRRFCNETAERTRETTTTTKTKGNDNIKKMLQGQTLNVQNKTLVETVHHTVSRFLCHESTTNVVRLNRNGNPIDEMSIATQPCVNDIDAREKTGPLK